MESARLHGVLLRFSCAPGVRDLAAELGLRRGIGGFEETNRGAIDITSREAGPEASSDPASEGYRPTFFHGIVQAYREPEGAPKGVLLWDKRSRVLVPEGQGRIEALVAGEELVPGSARATLEIALSLALRPLGLFHLHAAAVVDPEGFPVLVVGGSGAGKTTATIALVEAGYAFLGDDALLVEEGPRLLAFPRPFHVGAATLAAFGRLAPLVGGLSGHADKRDLDPDLAFPGRARASCEAPALVLHPRIERGTTTSLFPLSKAEALGNLVASSGGLVIEGAPHKEAQLALLGRITNGARQLELCMSEDLLADPSLLSRALRAFQK